ncbi:hypothetical protein CL628_04415 [bacterium]|nr:hypothetical protein [bacterium]|tara:strand:+ start:267 stop:659 length:393 start_codon:yes stop_codon:yes gene_type:complete
MRISDDIRAVIENASAKALATHGPAGLNVVPVSTVRVVQNTVWLFNFFMDKTAQNVVADPTVSLACWDGFSGIQLRATARYITEGAVFREAVEWVQPRHPDRAMRGVLVLTPTACYDITADQERAGRLLS